MNHTSAFALKGIIVPMVTPLEDRGALDVAGMERLVEHLIEGGVHGIFLLGTTGEGPSLSYQIRRELIERACSQIAGRVPVLVGITDTAWSQSQRVAEIAATAGATALVLAPPYYFPLSQSELLRFVESACGELPLPLVLYNIPQLTKTAFEVDSVRRLMQHERILGIKDSSGMLSYFNALLELAYSRANWSVLMGSELLLADALAAGAHGGVPGGGNLFPALFAELYAASLNGDLSAVRACHLLVERLNQLYRVEPSAISTIAAVKFALSTMDICNDVVALPFRQFEEVAKAQIWHWLRENLELFRSRRIASGSSAMNRNHAIDL